MKEILVKASKEYSVVIGNSLLYKCGEYLTKITVGKKVALITDKNVDKLYSNQVVRALSERGYDVYKRAVKVGEVSKSGKTYLSLLEFLAENRFTRADTLIALGGGVVGDLTGFLASTYLRGIKYIQMPTTLLAMVDSSVGGKTAINLNAGKNLAGAFCQPSLVLADLDTLKSLPQREFSCGMAEVIKYAFILDAQLIDKLSEGMDKNQEEIIGRCVQLKSDIVEQDEFDNGNRQLLNFGHTLGHAIEKLSKFKISHGQAVAEGMKIITKKAVDKGLCDDKTLQRLTALLELYRLEKDSGFSVEDMLDITLIDKKRKDKEITIVLPKISGECVLQKMTIDKWKEFILS